jgi:hypothetical protein
MEGMRDKGNLSPDEEQIIPALKSDIEKMAARKKD